MTESHAHLDDERLSAALDGDDADGAVAAHLADCADCRVRSESLGAAAALVAASPVPALDPVLLDALIATAVAEADDRPAAPVVPLGPRRRGLRVPPPAWLVGAAAALVLLAGVGSLLRTNGTTADRAAMSARTSGGANETAALGGAESAGTGAFAVDAAADAGQIVGDLGDQSDPNALVEAVKSAPTLVQGQAVASDSAARSGGAAKAAAPSSATTTTLPANRARCEAAGRAIGAGRYGGLQSAWTVRWHGEDAEVLVFVLTEPAEGITRQALVLRRPDCALLADPRF